MNAVRLRIGGVLVICLGVFVLCCTCAMAAPQDGNVDRFAKAYRVAPTDIERRAVCIDAIDSGMIAQGRSVAVVDAIFGTKYAKQLPRPRELESGIVYFRPQQYSGRDDVQSAHAGWYLAFEYDSAGKLENYSLSNIHK